MDAAKNSREIVRNILAYCRKESTATAAEVDLVPLVESFTRLAASVLPVDIRLSFSSAMDHATVLADPSQLQQVLLNLTNNARDAMNGVGELTIRLDRLLPAEGMAVLRASMRPAKEEARVVTPLGDLDPERPHARIRVSDTGSGMAASVAARVFDPFSPPSRWARAPPSPSCCR